MENQSSDPVIRDIPWSLWMFGLVFAGIGGFIALASLKDSQSPLFPLLFSGVGVLMLVLPSVLTIRADRSTGFLTLTYRSLLTKNVKEIPLNEIVSIDIESSSSSRGGTTYRVAITENNGQVTPLRSYYSSGYGGKKRTADRLRELIGVLGANNGPLGLRDVAGMLTGQNADLNQRMQSRQEALTGANLEMRETAGVHWNVQSTGMGGAPVTRWFSPDYKTNGTFVFIAQKPAGQKTMSGMIGKFAMRASLGLYGFGGDVAPGSDLADLLALDPRLDQHFMAFSPDPSSARQILNPWVAQPLADWATRHPLQTVQAGNAPGQLVVLYSPNGVYAATMGTLDQQRLDELAAIGVELVKSQGL
jgi:hypothetical protein